MASTSDAIRNRTEAGNDDIYAASTPHGYVREMARAGYRMSYHMRPFLAAVVDASLNGKSRTKVLDLGCSYGLSAALLKTDRTYEELIDMYARHPTWEASLFASACNQWLRTHRVRTGVEVVGFDTSREAIDFATASQILDDGITCDLEQEDVSLTVQETRVIQQCDVLFSTGTIGYVTSRTVGQLLGALGRSNSGTLGPVALFSILELFEPASIEAVCAEHGLRFAPLSVRIPQRQVATPQERERVRVLMRKRGRSEAAQQCDETVFARLYVAAPPQQFDALVTCVSGVTRPFVARSG